MGFLKAFSSIFDSNARVEQNLENYSETFKGKAHQTEPPCVTLYDTFQLLGIGIHHWFKTPPVSNNICALYSCIAAPLCAKAFAHQLNLTGEPQTYSNPNSEIGKNFKKLLSHITDYRDLISLDELEEKFIEQNGSAHIIHPRKPVDFSISHTTVSIFYEWNKEGLISKYMS